MCFFFSRLRYRFPHLRGVEITDYQGDRGRPLIDVMGCLFSSKRVVPSPHVDPLKDQGFPDLGLIQGFKLSKAFIILSYRTSPKLLKRCTH